MAYAICYVIKINRLGRWIEPRFAARYCDQWNLGVCLYGIPAEADYKAFGADVDKYPQRYRLLDYSLPMPRVFYRDPVAAQQALEFFNLPGSIMPLAFPSPEEVADKLAALSRVIYVKMGDLMLLELHAPVPIEKGTP